MQTSPQFNSVDRPLIRTLSQYVARDCPSSLWQQRDDIVQQILVRLHRLSQSKRLEISPSYLKRAARHGVCDAWRRRTMQPLESAYEPVSPEPSPEHRVSHHRALAAARVALNSLPNARRTAVTLYLQGSQISEIARSLGCDRKRADNLVYRGLAALRRKMTASGYARDQLMM